MVSLKHKRILFISNKIKKQHQGGREKLTYLNIKIIKELFNENFFLHEVKKKKINSISDIIFSITGNIDGVTNEEIKKINEIIKKKKINYLYIDGSNLGKLSRKIKQKKIKILTFCHNVEADFFFQKFRLFINPRNFYIFLVNYFSELQTVFFSDYLVFLNKRDQSLMFNYYFKKKSFIIPMSMLDQFRYFKNSINKNKFIIFVGSNFYGNIKGIEWYINKVVPFINLKTYFIGKDLNQPHFPKSSKVIFKGYVKNLNYWYKKARFIVAPISDGSGMKTKVAEGLMYGKYIIGLKEAFIGYEKFEKRIGKKCFKDKDFIKSINSYETKRFNYFDSRLRNIFLKNFSNYSIKQHYKKIFNKI